eukprot:6400474-Pyramimonas_sp.AAC.2
MCSSGTTVACAAACSSPGLAPHCSSCAFVMYTIELALVPLINMSQLPSVPRCVSEKCAKPAPS